VFCCLQPMAPSEEIIAIFRSRFPQEVLVPISYSFPEPVRCAETAITPPLIWRMCEERRRRCSRRCTCLHLPLACACNGSYRIVSLRASASDHARAH
jgi:hypothetical protein